MVLRSGQDAYCYFMLRENGETLHRRVRSVQVQDGDTGDVQYQSGKNIRYNSIILDTGELNRKSGGKLQLLEKPRRGTEWFLVRGFTIAFAVVGITHVALSFMRAF